MVVEIRKRIAGPRVKILQEERGTKEIKMEEEAKRYEILNYRKDLVITKKKKHIGVILLFQLLWDWKILPVFLSANRIIQPCRASSWLTVQYSSHTALLSAVRLNYKT